MGCLTDKYYDGRVNYMNDIFKEYSRIVETVATTLYTTLQSTKGESHTWFRSFISLFHIIIIIIITIIHIRDAFTISSFDTSWVIIFSRSSVAVALGTEPFSLW